MHFSGEELRVVRIPPEMGGPPPDLTVFPVHETRSQGDSDRSNAECASSCDRGAKVIECESDSMLYGFSYPAEKYLEMLKAREFEWQAYPTIPVVPPTLRWGYNINTLHTCVTPLFSNPLKSPLSPDSPELTKSLCATSGASGMLSPSAFMPHNDGTGNGKRSRRDGKWTDDENGNIVCHHFQLPFLWESLEEASTYGVEVPCMDSDAVCSQVAYIPYLSALYLIPKIKGEPCVGSSHLHRANNIEVSANGEESDLDSVVFFDTKPPYIRRPLTQMIRMLREATDPMRCEDADIPVFNARQIALLDANTKLLDEDSWMAIYWHPVETEMRRSSGGGVAPTFLICYSLAGAAAQKGDIEPSRSSSIADHLPSLWKGPGSILRRKVEKLSRLYSEMCPMMLRIDEKPRLMTFATVPCYADAALWAMDPGDDNAATVKLFKENNRVLFEWLRQRKMHLPDLEWITRRQKIANRWSQSTKCLEELSTRNGVR